jgi:energy-coupling factor transporter ATP-binding protein EcfA2
VDGHVALVFQDPDDQFFASTPIEDLLWGLRQRGVVGPAAEARAQSTLSALGVAACANRPIPTLSFGEKKRVAFASALVTAPRLLLCDEPTMGLDPVAAARLSAALAQATRQTPCAVVWATHDLAHLPPPLERVVLLRDGRVVVDGVRASALSPAWLEAAGLRDPNLLP